VHEGNSLVFAHGNDLGGLLLNQSLELAKTGILTIKPLSAKIIRVSETLGKMSPYCTFSIDGKKYKSKPDGKGGKEPMWGDQIKFGIIPNLSDDIFIRIWDQDLVTPSCIGSA
jgi:Ca2+-dependent lipid-binding protein